MPEQRKGYSYQPPATMKDCIDSNINEIVRVKEWTINKIITKALLAYFKTFESDNLCKIE